MVIGVVNAKVNPSGRPESPGTRVDYDAYAHGPNLTIYMGLCQVEVELI